MTRIMLHFTMLLLAYPATAQQLHFDPVVDLMLGTDSLAPGDARPEVTEDGRGGWFVAGLQLSHKWAEFGPGGELVRAPGKDWDAGGPGEYRSIEFVLPLLGDTVLVVDQSRLVWALRDGTYLRQEILPFHVREHVRHADRIWLVGSSLRSLALVGLDAFGRPEHRVRFPVSERTGPTAHPVSIGGTFWLWEYPRGPLHRLNPAAGQVIESIDPFPDRGNDTWRAFARPGPSGTLLFDVVDSRRRDQQVIKVMGTGGRVTEWAWPAEGDFKDYFAHGWAWGPAYVQDPIELWAGVRIYRVTLPDQGDL